MIKNLKQLSIVPIVGFLTICFVSSLSAANSNASRYAASCIENMKSEPSKSTSIMNHYFSSTQVRRHEALQKTLKEFNVILQKNNQNGLYRNFFNKLKKNKEIRKDYSSFLEAIKSKAEEEKGRKYRNSYNKSYSCYYDKDSNGPRKLTKLENFFIKFFELDFFPFKRNK